MWEEDSEEEGCRQTITHAEIESHKQRCVYRVIRCPYGAFDCPLIRKKALPLHLARCFLFSCFLLFLLFLLFCFFVFFYLFCVCFSLSSCVT